VRFTLFAQGVDLSTHCNAQAFEGCLCEVGVATGKAPGGARGHNVILTRAATVAALPSLLGMAVDYKAGWDGHDVRQKCGIITEAWLEKNRVMVVGYIFKRDFPEIGVVCREQDLGMSYEVHDSHIADMRSVVWTISKCEFTGAAILLREKAAYKSSSFRLIETDS